MDGIATQSIERFARRLSVASIRHGAGSTGDAADAIGELYATICEALHGVNHPLPGLDRQPRARGPQGAGRPVGSLLVHWHA
jgi:hypothetical protein